jgi:hypothetical protein
MKTAAPARRVRRSTTNVVARWKSYFFCSSLGFVPALMLVFLIFMVSLFR